MIKKLTAGLILVLSFGILVSIFTDIKLKTVPPARSGEAFVLVPADLALTSPAKRPKDVFIKSSLNSIGFFWDLFRQSREKERTSEERLILIAKHGAILVRQNNLSRVVGNYRSPDQLYQWQKSLEPKFWQIWLYKNLYGWEANLGALGRLSREEIESLAREEDESFRTEKFLEFGRMLNGLEDDLRFAVEALPPSQKEYRQKMLTDVFGELRQKILAYLPSAGPGEFVYFFPGSLKEDGENWYYAWLDTSWFEGTKAEISLEFNDRRPDQRFTIIDKKGFSLGKINAGKAAWVKLKISGARETAPKAVPWFWFKEAASSRPPAAGKPSFPGKLSWLVLLLGAGGFWLAKERLIKWLSKGFGRAGKIFIGRPKILVGLYLLGLCLGIFATGAFFDFFVLWTIFFWALAVVFWKIRSFYSFLLAFLLVFLCLPLTILNKELSVEALLVMAYMFLLIGTGQLIFSD